MRGCIIDKIHRGIYYMIFQALHREDGFLNKNDYEYINTYIYI